MELITQPVRSMMSELEAELAAETGRNVRQPERLRSIGPETGRFLLTLAVAANSRKIVEVGTSGGYSTLWLAAAAARTGGHVTTFEVDPDKLRRARRTFAAAGVESLVELRAGDGGVGLAEFHDEADLVFIDSEKDDYVRLLDLAISALRFGGLLIADNLISHADALEAFKERALNDPRLSALIVPIGTGELVAARLA